MENIMENIQDFKRIEKNKPQQQELVDTINIKSTGSTKKYIAYAVKLLINEKFPTIYLKASGNAVNRALITADILRKKIKGLAQINEVKSEEIEDEYIKKNCENSEKNEKNEKVIIKKNFALLQITLSNENNLDHSHYGYQPPIPVEKVKEFGTSFLPKDEKKETNRKKAKFQKYLEKRKKNKASKGLQGKESKLYLVKSKALKQNIS